MCINKQLWLLLFFMLYVDTKHIFYGYHEEIGIPSAIKVKKVEESFSKDSETKILGGSNANSGTFYYQAGLLITLVTGWTSICSGSLISPSRVLTAAHCYWDGRVAVSNITVVLDSVTLYSGGTRVVADDVVVHIDWNPEGILFDVAILKFVPVMLANNIYPIALPTFAEAAEEFTGFRATASGYGKSEINQILSPTTALLTYTDFTIIRNRECEIYLEAPVHGSLVCGRAERAATCDGDSGGPVAVTLNGRRILIGITIGANICRPGYPSLFTRTTPYLPWIIANMD